MIQIFINMDQNEHVMKSQQIFAEMEAIWEAFVKDNKRYAARNVKAAGARARKAATELRKLAGNYRSSCIEEIRSEKN